MNKDNFDGMILGIIIGIIICIVSMASIIPRIYKNGQIDAINGNIKYELKAMPDNSIVWVKK
ncbi:MAG: hypothetical protein M0P71_01060 [Melioribacteraceae bacterium]|nr:hypothetical protein [Melioribacteraceae bacterium]